MEELKKYKKQIIGIIMFILFFFIPVFAILLLKEFGLNVNTLSDKNKNIVSILINLVYPIFLIICYRKTLVNDFKKLKKEYKLYLEKMINLYIIGLLGMILSNWFLQSVLNLGIAGNEEGVRNSIITAPLYSFVSACIIAPFQEEMVFRKVIRDIFKNKYIFIIVSGLIFGLLHVLGIATGLDYLYVIPYGFLGAMFALIYIKTDNIWCPISIHLFHNTILVLLQLKANGIL